MDAFSIAASGMAGAIQRLDKAASTVVRAGVPGSGEDMAAGLIEAMRAKEEFKADVSVAKVADQMTGVLLDMIA